MNMSPVSRLKKTWGKAKTAKFFILEVKWSHSLVAQSCQSCDDDWRRVHVLHVIVQQHQMDPTGNFYNYRTALRGAAHRSRTANSNREKVRGGILKISGISSAIPTFLTSVFVASDCNPLLQSADQRHLLPERRMCKPAAQRPRQLWGQPLASPLRHQAILEHASRGAVTSSWFFSPLEICGAGSPGRGVHDVETGGVSIWGGSRHPALPPHRAHL